MKLLIENWRKYLDEEEFYEVDALNENEEYCPQCQHLEEKKKGIDGKACWDGYKYAGTENGKDKCVPMEEEQDVDAIIDEEIQAVLDEKAKKPCNPSKGKRFAKRVDGKCRSYGQSGQAKSGGDRIRPGTKKGDAYCARSAGIKKCKNPPCANTLSRKKWKCRGKKSMKEQSDETPT
jgi:hypothetical protein|tara:strand:+ start:3502 stop:4032 length:531 start_codon:yes stop_codon:yes gene_type:complete